MVVGLAGVLSPVAIALGEGFWIGIDHRCHQVESRSVSDEWGGVRMDLARIVHKQMRLDRGSINLHLVGGHDPDNVSFVVDLANRPGVMPCMRVHVLRKLLLDPRRVRFVRIGDGYLCESTYVRRAQ
jgi:hypothetical protein